MTTKYELKKAFPALRKLIDALWPTKPAMYREKYDEDLAEGTPSSFLPNSISPDVDFGVGIGQDNTIEGNRSDAFGQGLNTKSFLEILLGTYATAAIDQDPEVWVELDRLLGIGNGTSNENRSMALEIFKSGLIKLFNAIEIGDYNHGAVDPANGTLRYTPANGLQIRHGGAWVNLIAVADTSCEFSFKFEVAEAFTFVCPEALKFTSMEHQQVNAPTLSVALDTNMAKYDDLVITPDAFGLVILKGIYL